MILVDTSVWVDHLRSADALLSDLLDQAKVLIHPFVIGEIACGSLADRAWVLGLLRDLPPAVTADDGSEILDFIERHGLHGKGIGYVDMHLLAAVALSDGATLWTRDRRLREAADLLGCAFQQAGAH